MYFNKQINVTYKRIYYVTTPRTRASPTKSSAVADDFRVYTPQPFPPVPFEEAHKSSCHSTSSSPAIGQFLDYKPAHGEI